MMPHSEWTFKSAGRHKWVRLKILQSGRVKWVADLSGIFLLFNPGDLKPNLIFFGAFGALVSLIFDIKISPAFGRPS